MDNALTEILEDHAEDAMEGKYLTFQITEESYAVPIRSVIEIVKLQPITAIPELAGYMKGIINLRGKIIPVMDVRLRLEKPAQPYNDRTCIVVVDINHSLAGLIVDQVSEVLTIRGEDILPPPDGRGEAARFVCGIGKTPGGIRLILDAETLFNGIV
jgi:purine-binding chemotaxis protein CheW